jgi:hypothetical protein
MENPLIFQAVAAASLKIRAFLDFAPCSLVVDRGFRGEYCLHQQDALSQKALIFSPLIVHHLIIRSLVLKLIKKFSCAGEQRIVLEMVIVLELAEGSFPCEHAPAIGPYSGLDVSSSYRILFRIRLILSSHVRLGLPSDFFRSSFRDQRIYTRLIAHMLAIFLARLVLLNFTILIISDEK